MENAVKQERLEAIFPFLRDAGSEFQEKLLAGGSAMKIPKNSVIFSEGDECRHVALILSGTARVYKLSESGREITLYRLEGGESCILTISSVLSRVKYPAIAVAEKDLEVILISSEVFRDWMNRYEPWRDYIFSLLSRRLSSVISTVEEVAFHRMDLRIAEYLLNAHPSTKEPLRRTHQEIAMDLGTSREVVSRILKDFEKRGFISLSRGAVAIRDRKKLELISEKF